MILMKEPTKLLSQQPVTRNSETVPWKYQRTRSHTQNLPDGGPEQKPEMVSWGRFIHSMTGGNIENVTYELRKGWIMGSERLWKKAYQQMEPIRWPCQPETIRWMQAMKILLCSYQCCVQANACSERDVTNVTDQYQCRRWGTSSDRAYMGRNSGETWILICWDLLMKTEISMYTTGIKMHIQRMEM